MPAFHIPQPYPASRHVFVYGTLRRGDDNDITRLQPPPRFVGVAPMAGSMFHLGAYPGVTLGGTGVVQGEVYAISEALERVLDGIESGYPAQSDEYAKRETTVTVNGVLLDCIVYEIDAKYIAGKPHIASGDWVKNR
jgi:gamma-glutamylcyclotransferase (GGCT)/AIG2-like uncharacterized protein YtfP